MVSPENMCYAGAARCQMARHPPVSPAKPGAFRRATVAPFAPSHALSSETGRGESRFSPGNHAKQQRSGYAADGIGTKQCYKRSVLTETAQKHFARNERISGSTGHFHAVRTPAPRPVPVPSKAPPQRATVSGSCHLEWGPAQLDWADPWGQPSLAQYPAAVPHTDTHIDVDEEMVSRFVCDHFLIALWVREYRWRDKS